MKDLWNNAEADKLGNDPLKLRVYSSRLLGSEEDLVLHGGGNTSVKTKEKNIFGEEEDIIHIKGSGWDLATIEAAGFAPVKLKELQKLAKLETLTDVQMVKYQRMAMTDPSAPDPSVEAILHAIIPHRFVDHTHADAIVTISNTPNGEERIRGLFGDRMLIVPYVMPGFVLAKEIYRLTADLDWDSIDGMILLHHGVFTFDDDAQASYQKMIGIVNKAEGYLADQTTGKSGDASPSEVSPIQIAELRKAVSETWKTPVLLQTESSTSSIAFSNRSDLERIATKGPLTPDHIIRTKRIPMILSKDIQTAVNDYAEAYLKYFHAFNTGERTALDAAPRWAIWPGYGTVAFGTSVKNACIVQDIAKHTKTAITAAEQLGGWQTLSQKDLFEMEYWVLEQNKLKKTATVKPMQGRIALVTGAASGIGKACVERLIAEGAVVAALDINPSVHTQFDRPEILTLECDQTDSAQLRAAVEKTVKYFGGLDMLVANAGIFPKSHSIENMDDAIWRRSLDVNLTGPQQLLKACVPYLELGMEPAIVIIGSKNVAAPGPGASAYSVAKAGLTQLGRIAAMELGEKGIRVNTLHPNAVYDTAIWTEEVLQTRAAHYKLTVGEYKANNILRAEVTSKDVAEMAVVMLGPKTSKITGAQIPVDGGNDRTI